MDIFKKKLQIAFVLLLSLVFVNCSSDTVIDDKEGGGIGGGKNTTHTYDITFTKGSETVHYKGSVTMNTLSENFMSMHGFDIDDALIKGSKAVALLMKDKDVLLNSVLYLKSSGVPYPLNMDAMDDGIGSAFMVTDSKKSMIFMSVSGTASLKNLKLVETVEPKVQLASYTLDIDGKFELVKMGSGDDPIPYSGKGKIVVNPYKIGG